MTTQDRRAASSFPFQILVVEDDEGWRETMTDALTNACRKRPCAVPAITPAIDADEARRELALNHFHLVSLDMRLPARKNDTVDVQQGIELAESMLSPMASLPKTILYTATLTQEQIQATPFDGFHVAERLPLVDKYAKASGADLDPTAPGPETLSQRQWAERVIDYLWSEGLELANPAPNGKPRQSALGAWLTGAVLTLPPVLARQAQELHTYWPAPGRKVNAMAVDAALRFIETTLRLAVAQTGVLSGWKGTGRSELPGDDSLTAPIELLRASVGDPRSPMEGLSWGNHLTAGSVDAFDAARRLRNDIRHSLRADSFSEHWRDLLPLVRRTMDVAAYWAKHPLCTELRYGRDGWRGELVAGTAWPRPERGLPGKDFPGAAVSGFWQTAVRRKNGEPGWEEIAVSWQDWLAADAARPRALLLKCFSGHRGVIGLDLDSGEKMPYPAPSGRR